MPYEVDGRKLGYFMLGGAQMNAEETFRKRWEERNKLLWSKIEAAIGEEEAKWRAQQEREQRAREEEARRKKEAEELKLKAEEAKRKAMAEAKRKEEEAKKKEEEERDKEKVVFLCCGSPLRFVSYLRENRDRGRP